MPTPTGLPKVGEVWELDIHIPGRENEPQRVVVLERSRGDYWALRVVNAKGKRALWVDPAYWLQQGWLKYVGPGWAHDQKEAGTVMSEFSIGDRIELVYTSDNFTKLLPGDRGSSRYGEQRGAAHAL